MDNLKIKAKEYGEIAWSFLKEKLQRFWVLFRRTWKKYHVTKAGILAVLTVGLILSLVLTIQARQISVESLQVGLQVPTRIMDNEGEQAGILYAQKGTYVPIEEISPTIQNAVISTEDKRFQEHMGFDPIGMGRAAVGYVLNGRVVGGGSTITQQLTKNAYLTADQTLLRKLKELFLAIEIEKSYSKDMILEMYLNNSYFGQSVWGVHDASLKYFNKDAADLTISEGATLAGMLKNPSNYNPIDDYERAIGRRNVVLSLMESNGAITPDERQAAKNSDLTLSDGSEFKNTYVYPYYFDSVIREAKTRFKIAEEDLLNNGYTIYTALNQEQQKQMTKIYNEDWRFETAADGMKSESASIALNPQTGGITAVMGGRVEENYQVRGLNRATQMRRSPGSTIKPLSVYAPALEAGWEIDSMIEDELQTFGADENGTGGTLVENVDKVYDGELPMYEALAVSKNSATMWLLNEIGLRRGYNKLKEFGLTVTQGDYGLNNVALGGMEYGASPLEMASAYSVFANDGVRIEPHFITKIVDATGAVVVDNSKPKSNRVLNKEVNDDMNRMLLNVVENGGASRAKPAGYQIAAKTGTHQTEIREGATDQWIVGYTPDLVIASWAGYDITNENDGHYMKGYASSGIGQVLKAEFETMIPHTKQTAFAVDNNDIEVIVRENKQNETVERIKEGVKEAGKVLQDTTNRAVDGAKRLLNRFINR